MAIYNFEILGEPVAKEAVKVSMHGKFVHKYMPKKTRNAMADIRSQIIAQLPNGFRPTAKPLNLTVQARRQRPKSTPKRVKYPITRPDASNYLKLIEDALNGLVWLDDSQVVRIFAGKEYATEKHPPGITLMIEELEG